MLLKLLLGIPSAVEESLTSQGRVALFFTHRLRLKYRDRTWSRREIVGDPSTPLRSAQDDKERIPRARSRDAQPMSLRVNAAWPLACPSPDIRTAHAHVLSSRAQARDLTHGR